jgi:[protein-PII] uridylyltransferase
LWRNLKIPKTVTLVAVGGYGRQQLFPYSDIDLLFLLDPSADEAAQKKLEQLISVFWDIGLEVGHSVRTVEECIEEIKKDVTVQTNLLEARFLSGSKTLYKKFISATLKLLNPQDFFNAKSLEQQQRLMRFKDTAYNLEPNLKESPGGLRDLQFILWVAQAAKLGTSWQDLAKRKLITTQEAKDIKSDETFLNNLRIHLHYLADRKEERLLFDFQHALAQQFGLRDKPERRASEQLMQAYYQNAKKIRLFNLILSQNIHAKLFPAKNTNPILINEDFQIVNELLEMRKENLFRRRPRAILDAFLIMQQHHELKGMAAATLRALWRANKLINDKFRNDRVNRARFMEILRQPRGVIHELRRMNQLGVLGSYMPAFGRIVGQMQHDLFHVYTVDEHILMVVRNLRRFVYPEFAHEFPLCSRLINDFERQEILMIAGLFHDIAKGRGGDHSTLGTVDAREFCEHHGISEEDTELICWLVQNHLVMSSTAQKQDLTDLDVIKQFAARVKNERYLTALYILTVADVRGTSPKVWNAWKGKLLEDLFWATKRVLSGAAHTVDSSLRQGQEEALQLINLHALPEKSHEAFWSQLDSVYFLSHSPQEVAWHTRQVYNRVNSDTPIVRARLSPDGEGLQVMVYIQDQEALFARICNFFSRINYNILEAKIHTTKHGYALDSFVVMDPTNKGAYYRDLLNFIEFELVDRLKQQTPLDPVAPGRLSRHLKHFPLTPQVNIQPDDKGQYHVMEILAGDRPGLLAGIARILAEHKISVHHAKINTLGERAEDTFLISGDRLNESKALIKLETDLLQQLQTA